MKKIVFILSFLVAHSCFAMFNMNLPTQIICDKPNYCSSSDDQYQIPGWSFVGAYLNYIKPGIYIFKDAYLYGDTNNNFIKQVSFHYEMIDNDGYKYDVSYTASNWLIPLNKEKYNGSNSSICKSNNVQDCYVTMLAPANKQ